MDDTKLNNVRCANEILKQRVVAEPQTKNLRGLIFTFYKFFLFLLQSSSGGLSILIIFKIFLNIQTLLMHFVNLGHLSAKN